MRNINILVIHHSASLRIDTTISKIRHWHTDPPPAGHGWPHIGYHIVIGMDGTACPVLTPKEEGFGVWDKNADTIHICVVGDFTKEFPTIKQINSLKNELLKLCRKFNLSVTHIAGHREIAIRGHETACPGNNLMKELPAIKAWLITSLALYPARPLEVEINSAITKFERPNMFAKIVKVITSGIKKA